jgi:hypothetical protein
MKQPDTAEARSQATKIADLITPQGARCSKRQGLHLIGIVQRLCDALDQARIELRQREQYQDLYGALVTDYNGLIGAMRELGIEVSQGVADAPNWRWTYGDLYGVAPSVPHALKTALIVAGVDKAEPGAEWAAERAAAHASAREMLNEE